MKDPAEKLLRKIKDRDRAILFISLFAVFLAFLAIWGGVANEEKRNDLSALREQIAARATLTADMYGTSLGATQLQKIRAALMSGAKIKINVRTESLNGANYAPKRYAVIEGYEYFIP